MRLTVSSRTRPRWQRVRRASQCRCASIVVVVVSIDRAAGSRVLRGQRRAVGERQRAVGHPLHVPLLERGVGAPQQPLHARDTASSAAAPAGRRRRAGTRGRPSSRANANAKIAAGRRHAAVQHIDPAHPPRRVAAASAAAADRTAPGRRRAAAAPACTFARESRVPSPRASRSTGTHSDDLVEVRRERIDVARERSFDLAQRAVGGAPERHVIDDAQPHARPSAASSRS